MNKVKEGDKVECIQTWRGDGDYIFGGQAAYVRGETHTVGPINEIDEGLVISIIDKKYGSLDVLYSFQKPFFDDYFILKNKITLPEVDPTKVRKSNEGI